MAGSVNKVILVGNLGRDPEVRRLGSGEPVVNLRIATSETWRDKQSGEKKERTEWHSVVIFNENLAKVAEQYLRKGSKIYIEGQLQTRKWQDQSGVEKYTTEIVLQRFRGELTILDSRQQGGGDEYGEGGGAMEDRSGGGGGSFGRSGPMGGGGGGLAPAGDVGWRQRWWSLDLDPSGRRHPVLTDGAGIGVGAQVSRRRAPTSVCCRIVTLRPEPVSDRSDPRHLRRVPAVSPGHLRAQRPALSAVATAQARVAGALPGLTAQPVFSAGRRAAAAAPR